MVIIDHLQLFALFLWTHVANWFDRDAQRRHRRLWKLYDTEFYLGVTGRYPR